MAYASEADLEAFALGELAALGIPHLPGADVAPDEPGALRDNWRQTLLRPRLKAAIERLNPHLSEGARRDALTKITDSVFPELVAENRRLHELIVRGVQVEHTVDGEARGALARLVDWNDEDNDWLAISQFSVAGRVERRPDIVVFLNGLPLVVIELKGTEGAGLPEAFQQLENYKADIPDLFRTNLFSVISDGVTAKYGAMSAGISRFMEWRTVDGETLIPAGTDFAITTLIRGLLTPATLLDVLRRFVVFEDEGEGPVKKIAGYHQFHAVRKAVDSVLEAREGDGRGGVIWHTQGSGKSLLMTFLAGALMHEPQLDNPTLLVLTDRNDLDDQLFGTFARCTALFGEAPQQANNVVEVKRLLDRTIGGVVFATIQKFRPEVGEDFPTLTTRKNVIVLVDEAHRSQYGFGAKLDAEGRYRYGFAHHVRQALPNATFVGFTGTPVELISANTYAVFGSEIDVYDIAQAVEDGATVPIYYEARVAKIELSEEVAAALDDDFDDATEDVDAEDRDAASRKWSQIKAVVGADARLDRVVGDILEHFDRRRDAIDGKAMIVCMSRDIAAAVYDRIVAARPAWHGDTDDTGSVKVVMTGNATDPAALQPHIRSKSRLKTLATRFRKPGDPFRIVIVCDMWLTGFDAPVLRTLYVDKPMRGHGLMQAIARVNRVFRNKPAGLVVDYIGLAADLKAALAHYSASDREETGVETREAAIALMNALDVIRPMFDGIAYLAAVRGTSDERMIALREGIQRALEIEREDAGDQDDGARNRRFGDAVAALSKAFKLASGTPEAAAVKEEVAFFIAVEAALAKLNANGRQGKSQAETDLAMRQLINDAVASTEVVDILKACGVDRPDIGVLSEEFLAEVREMNQKNLAVEALKKLLNGEIAARTRSNVVKQEEFSQRLRDAIARYHNRSIDALQVIQEMIDLAKRVSAEGDTNLSPEEKAFYDALATNQSAIDVIGNEELLVIASELVRTVRETWSVDWWDRENIKAKMRVSVRRILRRHGFPPDLEAGAVKTVLRQAQTMAADMRHAA
ncbi:MAG: type I restriction endonuclease subunit R [Pseudomonadota bacterium]